MNYLLDRKNKRRKFLGIVFLIIFCLVVFYFRSGIFENFSYASHVVFRPVLILGNKLGSIGSFFSNRTALTRDIEDLTRELGREKARTANYDSILAENISLKEILGRKSETRNIVLAAILSKPNQSPYDTLTIDAGTGQGLEKGDMVFAYSDVPIGRIAESYPDSSKVILFSSAGEKTQVVIGDQDVFTQIVGRGGGNFEIIALLDSTIAKGDRAILPGMIPYVVGVVEDIISDPRDSFRKALLTSP